MGEFIEFCVNGRNAKSGKWDTVGTGKYLEGGKAAGALGRAGAGGGAGGDLGRR